MAYCMNCGNELYDAAYCPMCGTPTNGAIGFQNNNMVSTQPNYYVQMQAQMEAYRFGSIQMVSNIYQYFDVRREEFKRLYELQEKVVPHLTRRSSAALVWGILLSVFALGLFKIFSGAFWLFAVLFLVVGVMLILLYIFKGMHSNRKLEKSKAEMQAINNDLVQYYNQSGYINIIGFEYVDPVVLEAIYQIIKSGRANGITDAIQQFQMDIRNDQLQSYSEEILRQIRSVRRWAKAGVGVSAANLGVSMFSWLI